MIFEYTTNSEAPSILALSTNSWGISFINPLKKKVQNPIWKAVWNNINDNFVSYKPNFNVKSLTGIIKICAGTKLPAINIANIKKFRLKLKL